MSTCVQCRTGSFEVVTVAPTGTQYKYNFVQCSICGGVVGVVDYFAVGSNLDAQSKVINGVRQALDAVQQTVANVERLVASLTQRK